MYKIFFFLFAFSLSLFLFSNQSFAGCQANPNRCANVTIELYPSGVVDNIFVTILDAVERQNLGCNFISGSLVKLPKSHINYSEIYSILLSSVLTRRPIDIRLRDDEEECTISYVKMQ